MTLFLLSLGCLIQSEHYQEVRSSIEDNDSDGESSLSGDCDDQDPTVWTGAQEVCDGIDNDCDGHIDDDDEDVAIGSLYVDEDHDGFGQIPIASCVELEFLAPESIAPQDGDCDDEDPLVSPAAEEICNNSIDDNCDGVPGDCEWSADHIGEDVRLWFISVDYSPASIPFFVGGTDLDGDNNLELATIFEQGKDERRVRGYEIAADAKGDISQTALEYTILGLANNAELGMYSERSSPFGTSTLVISSVDRVLLFAGSLSGTFDAQTDYDQRINADPYGAIYSAIGTGDLDYNGLGDVAVHIITGPETTSTEIISISEDQSIFSIDDSFASIETASYGSIVPELLNTGDIDGDGVDDIAILCPGKTNNQGQVNIYLGPLSEKYKNDADISISGELPQDLFGYFATIPGDTDGDGLYDLAISSILQGSGASGKVYLFTDVLAATTATDATATITASTSQDYLGYLSPYGQGGDFNGDGLDDLVLGAFGTSGAASNGIVYVQYAPMAGTISADAISTSFTGTEGNVTQFGSISGDYSRDGVSDLIMMSFDPLSDAAFVLSMVPGSGI